MTEPRPMPDPGRIRAESHDWLVLLDSGSATEADVARFRLWRDDAAHARIFEAERELWHDIGMLAVASGQARAPVRQTRRLVLRGGLALAAVAGAAAFGPALMIAARADHRTGTGDQARVTLPDGSLVFLNTETAIRVDYADGRRDLRLLQGEAMFLVQQERRSTFAVHAGQGIARTSGGAFSMRYEGGRLAVLSESAKLKIWGSRAMVDPAILLPEQKLRWTDGGTPGPAQPGDPEVELAWRDGQIVFDATPFDIAAQELGRYLPEKIILRGPAKSRRAVNGTFRIADAGDALKAITITQGLGIHRIPGVALIIS